MSCKDYFVCNTCSSYVDHTHSYIHKITSNPKYKKYFHSALRHPSKMEDIAQLTSKEDEADFEYLLQNSKYCK